MSSDQLQENDKKTEDMCNVTNITGKVCIFQYRISLFLKNAGKYIFIHSPYMSPDN